MIMTTSAEYHRRLTALLARPMFGHKKSIDFDITRGWLGLVERLVADLEALPDGGVLRCIPVKENFGDLRIHRSSDPQDRFYRA